MNFSQILLERRRQLGLSQEQLAEQLQVSRQAVSKWETGEAQPDMAKLMALAETLGVSMDALCGRAPAAAATADPTEQRPSGGVRPWLAAVLTAAALALGMLLGMLLSSSVVEVRQMSPEMVLEPLAVSGVQFSPGREGCLEYQFAAGATYEGDTCELVISAPGEKPKTFPVELKSGVASGSIQVPFYGLDLQVSLSVSNGSMTRTAVLANDLTLFENSVTWR